MVHIDRSEPVDRLLKSIAKGDLGLPLQLFFGQSNIRAATRGIIGRQRPLDKLRFGVGHLHHEISKLSNRELTRIAYIHRTYKIVGAIHHSHKTFYEIISIAEGSCLIALTKNGNVFTTKGLANEVGDDSPVVWVHPWPVGVEDSDDFDANLVHAVIIHEQRFRDAFSLVVT